jgi:hypothetical protein
MKVVCPNCRGNGIEPGTGITFTSADLDEAYGDDWEERREGGRAWAQHGERCTLCRGENVVTEERAQEWEEQEDERDYMPRMSEYGLQY